MATANIGAKKNGDSDYKNRPDSENLWKETTSIRHSPRLQTENSSLRISRKQWLSVIVNPVEDKVPSHLFKSMSLKLLKLFVGDFSYIASSRFNEKT